MYFFRVGEQSKPKLFAFKDHASPSELIQRVKTEFNKFEPTTMALKPTVQLKIRREILLQTLEHIAEMPGMEMYQSMGRDRLPKPYHNFQSFVNQSATEECQRLETLDILVDWNVPIRFRAIILPDNLM